MQRATEASTRSLDTLPAMTRVREGARRSPQQLNCSPQRGEHRACRGSCLPTTTARGVRLGAQAVDAAVCTAALKSRTRAASARRGRLLCASGDGTNGRSEPEVSGEVSRSRGLSRYGARGGVSVAGARVGTAALTLRFRLGELSDAAGRGPRADYDASSWGA